ncbi:MAG: glycosyltransferase family A protein [Anaerolineae bacterium]
MFPRITFGIIVLNGEPFTRYTLRALYPFAHEILVVEGAAPAAANVATPDGHSIDGTLHVLHQFKAEEDPDNKVQIITRDGFWSEKDEMSQAYAARATGDYLWQVDVDEFYQPQDMQAVIDMLRSDPDITAVSFKMRTFWGAPQYMVDGWYLRRGANIFHRLFKWGEGYTYAKHRPPTVLDQLGRNTRELKWMDGHQMARSGIVMYHYSLLLPKQVLRKSDYYGKVDWIALEESERWAYEVYMGLRNPYRVHNVYRIPSWLERYRGEHPPLVNQMWQDIQKDQSGVEIRQTDDIERVLNSPVYQFHRGRLRLWDYVDRAYHAFQRSIEPVKNPIRRVLSRLRTEA